MTLVLRCVVILLSLPAIVVTFDAVLWSSIDYIDRGSFPDVNRLVEKATEERPVVVFVVDGFQLAAFSQHTNVYADPAKKITGLKKWISSSKGYGAEWLSDKVQLPVNSVQEFTGELTSLGEKPVVVVRLPYMDTLDQVADNVFQSLDRPYTALLTNPQAIVVHKIKKRVSTSEDEVIGRPVEEEEGERDLGAAAAATTFPLVVPPENKTCLLYLGGIQVVVFKPNNKDQTLSQLFVADDAQVTGTAVCAKNSSLHAFSSFKITLSPGSSGSIGSNGDFKVDTLTFRLKMDRSISGYWVWNTIDQINLAISKNTTSKSTFLPVSSVKSFNGSVSALGSQWHAWSVDTFSFACGMTDAAWIPIANPGTPATAQYIQVGLSLTHFQVQPFNVHRGRFVRNVDDCVPTFSVGTWMGLLIGLLFLFILLFGVAMVNSVQTMDRFDDPKQKQIAINVKE